ncbi:MAG TPA: glycosyltransferase [Acetobacteraceae bacterium]|nr:glycosyltransferase [Acetobacteraceae bacterium]
MRTYQAGAPPPAWELACWRLAIARDRMLRRSTGWVRSVPGANWLRRQIRRMALLLWWTVTLQLPRHAAWWFRARRTRRRPVPSLAALIAGSISPASLRFDPSPAPVVSIIITSYGKVDYTLRCLASIAAWPPDAAVEIIVIDDASNDPELVHLELVRGIRLVINPTNLGYLRSCNVAARLARGEFVLLLNNDTQVRPGWLDSLAALLAARPDAAAAGSMLIYPDGRLQEAGGIIWNDGSGWNFGRDDDADKPAYNYVREVDYCSAASLMVRRAVFEQLGGFDEAFVPAYCEDSDLAFRMRARGWKVLYQPRSRVVHLEGVSHGTDTGSGIKRHQIINQRRFVQRWAGTLAHGHSAPGCRVLRARDRAMGRTIVLVIDHNVPEPDRDAGSSTMMGFVEALLSAGAVVKFWPHNRRYSPGYTEILQDLGVEVLHGGRLDAFDDWINENGPELDCVLLSRPDVAQAYLGALKQQSPARLIYYGHDLHFRRLALQAEVMAEPAIARDAARMERLERWIWRSVDVALYPSQEEAAVVTGLEPSVTARAVVPFGFAEFGVTRMPPGGHNLLFVGGFAHQPTEQALLWFVAEVLPLIRARCSMARLVVAGSRPGPKVRGLAGAAISILPDLSAEELRGVYATARVVVAPLRYGAGVKLKVVEALREGVPLVTTPIGAQGLPGVERVASVVPDPATFAEAVVRLLADDLLWQVRCAAQLGYARERFSEAAMRAAFLESAGIGGNEAGEVQRAA